MATDDIYKAAKLLNQIHGFNMIPSYAESKCPIGNWAGDSYNMKKDFKRRAAYTTNPLLGILVSSDFIVIDIDNKPPAVNGKTGMYSEQTGVSDFDTLVAQNEHLPMTLAVSTPSGGKHLYFKRSGAAGEDQIKNWAGCMTFNGKLIAVDTRVKGGYFMCPPSRKGMGVYSWMEQDTLGMRTPLAPLPKWILENILRTMDKNKPHFWLQKDLHTISPVDNEEIEGPHIALFKQSEWYQPSFQFSKPDHLNRINVTATAPYHCQICQRDHVKNSNHPFLVNRQGTLRFICRAGRDSSGHGFWRDIKANCHPDEGSRVSLSAMQQLYDKESRPANQPRLVAYLNNFLCFIEISTPIYGHRHTVESPWVFQKSQETKALFDRMLIVGLPLPPPVSISPAVYI
ncbi:hypothetical protein PhCBS80983_g05977 [Powellomyces hirtus]|uniref:DNA primase/polymerase bifunctional N-terminal domain-containing protein n=1 Tax=Powellomyces hirtus TaxID=109895 RepID=A0A507DS62_9FUNG|nr:hypothetical protein PhCBS80983_g05977 [Powellomyces hirtus]